MKLRRHYSELAALRGLDPAQIRAEDGVVFDDFQAVLEKLSTEAGGKRAWIYWQGRTIRAMAFYALGWDEARLRPHDDLCARLCVEQTGLTAGNRRRLSQFDDATLVRFLRWPVAEMDRLLARDDGTRRTAEKHAYALSLEFAIFTLLRIDNIAGLREGRHLHWSKPNRQGDLLLELPESEVKNGTRIRLRLPPSVADRIRLHMERMQPRLRGRGCDPAALFPGRGRERKRGDTLSRQFRRAVRDGLGLTVNPHLVRHLAARLVLKRRPAGYGLVSRLLAHKSVETAFRHYSGLEVTEAFELWDGLVLKIRKGGRR